MEHFDLFLYKKRTPRSLFFSPEFLAKIEIILQTYNLILHFPFTSLYLIMYFLAVLMN